jgi:hypothetical protein
MTVSEPGRRQYILGVKADTVTILNVGRLSAIMLIFIYAECRK